MNDQNDKLDDLVDRYVYGLLSEARCRRVRARIESDPEWQLAYEAAMERKRTLAGEVRPKTSGTTIGEDDLEEILRRARKIEAKKRRARWVVRGSLTGAAAAAVIVTAVAWIWVAAIARPPQVIRLVGQRELMSGSPAAVRAFVTDLDGDPISEATIQVALLDRDSGRRVHLADWTTDAGGTAGGEVNIPRWSDGQYVLVASTAAGRATPVEAPITIRRAHKVYLSTDKPIYQPGQTIHMRCLVLRKPALQPLSRGDAEFVVEDPRENIIFRQPVRLSEHGIASANLPLDQLISPGRYRVRAVVGDDVSEQTVEVFHYKLPAFSVDVRTDRPYYRPGDTVAGEVRVRYHFGKPVVGAEVELSLADRYLARRNVLRSRTVTTGEDGRAEFRIELPSTVFGSRRTQGIARFTLSARAVDPAGQENAGHAAVAVSDRDIRITAVCENGSAQPGVETRVFIVTSYPDGRPAETTVDVESLGVSVRTDEAGVAVLRARHVPDPLRISARDRSGRTGRREVSLPVAEQGFVLRTDRPVYTAGDTVGVEVVSPGAGDVFVDVIRDGQTMLTRTLEASDGRATAALDIPAELAGTLRVHAYRLGEFGAWIGRDTLIVVRPSRTLNVETQTDKPVYRPGRDAELSFRVTDANGEPAPAALSLAAVDEAVYSVQSATPGLAETLLGLDAELLAPAIEAHNFDVGMIGRDADYARAALASAVPDNSRRRSLRRELIEQGFVISSTLERLSAADLRAMLERTGVRDQLGSETIDALFGDQVHSLDYGSSDVARWEYYARKRSASRWAKRLTAVAVVVLAASAFLLMAFWPTGSLDVYHAGEPRLVSRWVVTAGLLLMVIVVAGSVLLPSLGRARELAKQASVQSDAWSVAKGLALYEDMRESEPEIAPSEDAGGDGEPARVRTYFPETMLWRPEVITDEQGRATLTVPLADSITTWRVTGSAVSRAGELGTLGSSIRVYQPFFVDIDAPSTLTAGDEVSVPLILYNYTDGPLEVTLRPTCSGALSLAGDDEQTVALDAGQVRRTLVALRADSIGTGELTVHASAGEVADAIRKSLRVVPPGRPESFSVNGILADRPETVTVRIPEDAVDGSVDVRMKLYPSTFSELLDGLEGIFRQPHGCFEQTSSTTYPNVMALAYMRANDLDNPEVRAKATRYVQMGYQRLLSFEVADGGFSLFGRAPASLTLTAYGMAEFADMAKVYPVDPGLLERVSDWLAKRQDADGSWSGALPMSHYRVTRDRQIAPTAYVTWALGSYDSSNPAAVRGARYVASHIDEVRDPHTLAICVLALLSVDGQNAEAIAAARRLVEMGARAEKGEWVWTSSGTPMTYGSGRYADVETTALAATALFRAGVETRRARGALSWLVSNRSPRGGWGTTQSTVLALKALLAGATLPQRRSEPAGLSVALADASEGAGGLGQVEIRPEQSDVVHTLGLDRLDAAGAYRLRLSPDRAEGFGYQIVVNYRTLRPPAGSEADGSLTIVADYDRTTLEVGGTVRVHVEIANNGSAAVAMPLADVGTPPGFAVRPDGLDKAVTDGRIERYSLTARGVILYLDNLQPRQRLEIDYEMVARMPLRAVSAPTRVYAYYDPQVQAATNAVTFTVE